MTTSSAASRGQASQDTEGRADAAPPDEPNSTGEGAQAPPPADWYEPITVEAPTPRRGRMIGGVVGVLLVIGVATFMSLRPEPGVQLVGLPVASVQDGADALDQAESALEELTIELTTSEGTTVALSPAELGVQVDRQDGLDQLAPNPAMIGNWVGAVTGDARDLALPLADVDPQAAADAASALTLAPTEPYVSIGQSGVVTGVGRDGLDVSADEVVAAVERALDPILTTRPDEWPEQVRASIDGQVAPPVITQADIDALTSEVESLADATVRVTARVEPTADPDEGPDPEGAAAQPDRVEETIELADQRLLELMDVAVDLDAPEGERLSIVASTLPPPSRLRRLLDASDVPPSVDAHIENRSPTPRRGDGDPEDLEGVTGDVVVDDVEAGFTPDAQLTAEAIVEAAREGGGEVDVVGVEEPEVTAESLGIVEPVSTFTTYYEAGQSRVTNIRRMAELVDGAVILPGESFELNRHVGRRTRDNGFTGGGAIQEGIAVTEVGGGVSQFATTLFNAAWFAGIELVDHKPHSVYFSRYPPGREATVNWPNVNLEIRNNTPYAILVDTDSNATSVTVTFWSTPHWEVQTIMGPCACGGSFRITNERILTSPGGVTIEEEYETIYTVLKPGP